jgi:hypothetical protein
MAEVRQLVPRAYVGDVAYAEVNSAWLPVYYTRFRTELSRLGIIHGGERFECNRSAELYTGVAQVLFFQEAFHSDTEARALAVGPFWHRPDGGTTTHAIVQVLTERGLIFIDSQNGAQLELSAQEIASAFLQVL